MKSTKNLYPNKNHLIKAVENLSFGVWEGFHVYADIIQGCITLNGLTEGRCIHIHITKIGLENDMFTENKLISMYAKCGSILDAREVFNKMSHRDVISWTSIISGYAQWGLGEEAFKSFQKMRMECQAPNKITFLCIIEAFDGVSDLRKGKLIHVDIIGYELESDIMLGTSLISMYGKCGGVEDAFSVFNETDVKDVVSWTAMISVYAQHEYCEEALQLFKHMECQGIEPNEFTFSSILSVCHSFMDNMLNSRLHLLLAVSRFCANVFVGAALLTMYARSGRLQHAHEVFDKIEIRDVASWTALITGYAHHGFLEEALMLFEQMQLEGLRSDVVVGNALIDLFAKSGNVMAARGVFERMLIRDVISWSTLASGYVQEGFDKEAIKLFCEMLWRRRAVLPDKYTVSSVLCACANLAAVDEGKGIHAYIIELNLELDTYVGNALVNMYAKCDCMEDASTVFRKVDETSLISWNAIILGYGRHGCGKAAYCIFQEVLKQRLKPDEFTFSGILSACADVGMLAEGKEVHRYIMETRFQVNEVVGNALIDMYAACGSLYEANMVFESMHTRDVISWSSVIGGWAQHGYGKEAFALFQRMQEEGMQQDEFTYSSLLVSCNHAGLIAEGCLCFHMMMKMVMSMQEHAVMPASEHYAAMVDLLGRSGCLDDALKLINMMPVQPHCPIWMSLLAACRDHVNLELAGAAAKHAFSLGVGSAGAYVLLSNMYAIMGVPDQKMRSLMGDYWLHIDITWRCVAEANSMDE